LAHLKSRWNTGGKFSKATQSTLSSRILPAFILDFSVWVARV